MINIIKAILEDAEPVTNQGQYESENEFENKETISKYKDFTDKVGELKENLYDMADKIKSSKVYESYPVHKVHYGSIDNNKHDDINLDKLSKYSNLSSVTDEILGQIIDVNLSTRLVLDLLNKNIGIIDNIGSHVWENKDKLSNSDLNGARNLVYIYGIKCQELINVVKNSKMSDSDKIFNEAASTDEDVAKYVSELNKLIPEIRDYYDKFQYKELVTPRKKHQEKMESYMRGALRRKYELRIPIYKIEDPTKDVKHMVRIKFIPAIKSIVNKYPNYQLIVPNFNDEDSDMFIYITLKEPFGDNGDRTDRKEQTAEIKEKKKDVINECSFDYPYDEDYDILDESCDTDDILDEGAVQTSKKYKLRTFLDKYNFVPNKEANGKVKTGTIEIEGQKYKIDINTKNPVMPSGDSEIPRATCVGIDGVIYLDKEFEDLKNNKRRTAILNHELGHIVLNHVGNSSAAKASSAEDFKNAILRDLVNRKGYSHEKAKNLIKNKEYSELFDKVKERLSSSEEAKLRDEAIKILSKYDKSITGEESHANTKEFEADRYAINREGGEHLKRSLRELYNMPNKTKATIKTLSNIEIRSKLKETKEVMDSIIRSDLSKANIHINSVNDLKTAATWCKNTMQSLKKEISPDYNTNDIKIRREINKLKGEIDFYETSFDMINKIKDYYNKLKEELKNKEDNNIKEYNKGGNIDYNQRVKALNDKSVSNKAYAPKRAVRSIGESVEYYDEREVLEEAALTSKQREDLPSDDYGIPSLKAFPINDKAHVQKAIQLFSHAKPKNKKELAKNIVDKIIELKLVGKIKVNSSNPNAKYFPKWLTSDGKVTCEYNNDGTYKIIINTESNTDEITGKVKSAVMQESGIKVII